jgi:site-specific DNA recombinase
MTRVCVYTRISTDEEDQPTSLASQHERLDAFCMVQEDWRIIAHHEDRATGTKLDRPGLQAALDLARQGRIDQLLVYRIDRLSRKVRQLASIADELDTLNVVLRSATEPFDTGSPAGRMMLQMLGVFAEFEHATIVDRITAGIERRAREGRWYSGRPPFGYTLKDGQLAPDPITAPTVRRIYQLYIADRLGTIAIAHQLRAEHTPAPRPRRPISQPSPISLRRCSHKASPSKPRRSCASSSPSCASTARPRSSRLTASSRQGFAQRQEKWAVQESNLQPWA